MFENIICQDEIAGALKDDIASGRLPSSLLLWGPDFSGKLSVALELARVLSCEEKEAKWGCGCKSCEEHRLLAHPHTLLIGGRYFYEETAACADTLRKTGSLPARYLFIRAVRKLLRRFDSALWEGKEADLKIIAPALTVAEEAVRELLPGKDLPSGEKLAAISESALDAVKKICEAFYGLKSQETFQADTQKKGKNLNSTPIDLLRNAVSWAHVGASGAAKVIIIENADKMHDSARNSLLKILEEPPPHVTFILTTPRRAAILPTILSRVRTYRFIPRDEQAGRLVLTKIFREESLEFTSLRDFFRLFQGVDPLALRKAARDFLQKARAGDNAFPAGDESWFADKTKFRIFLQELADTMERALRGESGGPELPVGKLEEWTALMRKTLESLDVLSIAPALLAQRLYNAIGRP
ncbi:MAG: hypothetical protein LBT68_06400 [Spirochaetales bacterium]|jgi:DNA polymerase-3 subunit gamma/tau|nr:hypothetical protein [Spirochaetales bacterium]